MMHQYHSQQYLRALLPVLVRGQQVHGTGYCTCKVGRTADLFYESYQVHTTFIPGTYHLRYQVAPLL